MKYECNDGSPTIVGFKCQHTQWHAIDGVRVEIEYSQCFGWYTVAIGDEIILNTDDVNEARRFFKSIKQVKNGCIMKFKNRLKCVTLSHNDDGFYVVEGFMVSNGRLFCERTFTTLWEAFQFFRAVKSAHSI